MVEVTCDDVGSAAWVNHPGHASVRCAIAHSGHGSPGAAAVRRDGSLMLVAGVDTSTGNGALFRFDPHAIGYSCAQAPITSILAQTTSGSDTDAISGHFGGAPS